MGSIGLKRDAGGEGWHGHTGCRCPFPGHVYQSGTPVYCRQCPCPIQSWSHTSSKLVDVGVAPSAMRWGAQRTHRWPARHGIPRSAPGLDCSDGRFGLVPSTRATHEQPARGALRPVMRKIYVFTVLSTRKYEKKRTKRRNLTTATDEEKGKQAPRKQNKKSSPKPRGAPHSLDTSSHSVVPASVTSALASRTTPGARPSLPLNH